MRVIQDIFEIEHSIGEDAPIILHIIGAYTAFKMPSGTWTWDFHYGAYFGDLWLKSEYLDHIERFEIDNRVNNIISQRVDGLELSEKFSK